MNDIIIIIIKIIWSVSLVQLSSFANSDFFFFFTNFSTATMERANSRRRIGVNGIMILFTLGACLWIIKTSQKGRDENTLESLHERNVKRYEKLREEDAAAAARANSEKK